MRMRAHLFLYEDACASLFETIMAELVLESHRKRCPNVFLNYRFNQLNGYKIPILISLKSKTQLVDLVRLVVVELTYINTN